MWMSGGGGKIVCKILISIPERKTIQRTFCTQIFRIFLASIWMDSQLKCSRVWNHELIENYFDTLPSQSKGLETSCAEIGYAMNWAARSRTNSKVVITINWIRWFKFPHCDFNRSFCCNLFAVWLLSSEVVSSRNSRSKKFWLKYIRWNCVRWKVSSKLIYWIRMSRLKCNTVFALINKSFVLKVLNPLQFKGEYIFIVH